MNTKDLKILSHLRKDARMPLTKMSKQTSIPVSTLFDRLKIQEDKFIVKHTSLIDFTKLGFFTRANITFKIDRGDKESFKDYLLKHPSVNSVYRINNGYDFMLEGVFKQIVDMEDFIEKIEERFNVLEKNSFYIIEDLKREAFLSDPHMLEM
jgi:DNA-binding Lrp family transcriptional regulator